MADTIFNSERDQSPVTLWVQCEWAPFFSPRLEEGDGACLSHRALEQPDCTIHKQDSIFLPRYYYQTKAIAFFSWSSKLSSSKHHLQNFLIIRAKNFNLNSTDILERTALRCGGRPAHHRIYTSTLDLHPRDSKGTTTSSVLSAVTIKMSPDTGRCPLGEKSPLIQNTFVELMSSF